LGSNVCAGHGDALVCDPAVASQATVCKGNSAADSTAVLQDGAIVCE
jgi:hypothetical protein